MQGIVVSRFLSYPSYRSFAGDLLSYVGMRGGRGVIDRITGFLRMGMRLRHQAMEKGRIGQD
jgi:hypothetical protein